MSECYHGVYRNVPFKLAYDEFTGWDMVDPRCCLSYEGNVFLGYGLQTGGGYRHINYGDKHVDFAEEAFAALINARYDKIVRSMKKAYGKEKWAEELQWYGHDAEEAADYMIRTRVAEALKEGDTETLAQYLTYAKVDYIMEDLTGDSQGDHCKTLFFKIDGAKITKQERKEYSGQLRDINNWLWGNVYEASVPFESCCGFVEDPCPEDNDKSGPMCFVHEEIDALLAKETGTHIVIADGAELDTSGRRPEVKFNPNIKVRIHVDSIEDAKEINGWFDGNALVEEKSKDKGRGRD